MSWDQVIATQQIQKLRQDLLKYQNLYKESLQRKVISKKVSVKLGDFGTSDKN